MKYDRATALHDNVTHVSEWTQRLKREYTDKRLMANIFTWSCKRWCAVQVRNSEKKCVAPVARILHRERKKKKIELMRENEEKEGEKKAKGRRIGKKRKGKEKASNCVSFSSLFLRFCRGPWREKWKTRNERQRQRLVKGRRHCSHDYRTDFERKLPKLLIGYLVKIDNIIIANIYYEYLFIR